MKLEPLISIIIPVYNAEKFLDNSVSSILNQTNSNFEILLINDGSTDSSASICDDFAMKDPRVIPIHANNGGVSRARNIGIDNAKGDYIIFVDNDDALPQNALELYLSKADQQEVSVIQGNVRICTSIDNSELKISEEGGTFKVLTVIDFIKISTNRTGVWGKLYKASIAKKYRFPEGHYCEDVYFNGLFLSDDEIEGAGILDADVYFRYDNPESASHLWVVDDYFDMIKVVDALYWEIKKKTNEQRIRDQYLKLFFTQYCEHKYNILLRKAYIGTIKKILCGLKNKNMKELWTSRLGFLDKMALFLFSGCNAAYRQWLIRIDPTMLDYEKAILLLGP